MSRSAAHELDGRTALVTGASRGIGRAIALELAQRGARVIAVARGEQALRDTCSAIDALGGRADAIVCDVRDAALLERLDELAPSIDVLVNNAAAFAQFAALERASTAEIESVLDVGVRAPLRLIAHLLPGMKQRGFGRIVNIGSLAAEVGSGGQVAYSTAKSALIGMTRSVAAEGARHGVTCNLVEPGLIATERIDAAVEPRTRARILANVAQQRIGTVEEVAYVVACLCSPRASYVTGATVPVSGGLGLGLYARDA